MNRPTSDPTSPFRSIFIHVPMILSAMFWLGPVHAAKPAIADETGIKGKVLRGPVHPGPATPGDPDEVPFRAAFQVLDSAEEEVASFESDDEGRFTVSLPPGDYTIVPHKSAPILFPKRQKKEVTVPEDGFLEVTLRFDTGMR